MGGSGPGAPTHAASGHGEGLGWNSGLHAPAGVVTHDGPTDRHPAHPAGGQTSLPLASFSQEAGSTVGAEGSCPSPLPSHTASKPSDFPSLPADPWLQIFPNQVCFWTHAAHDLFLFMVTMKGPPLPNNLGHYTPGTHHGPRAPALLGRWNVPWESENNRKTSSSSAVFVHDTVIHPLWFYPEGFQVAHFPSHYIFRTIFLTHTERPSSEMLLGVSFVSLYKLRWKCHDKAVITSPTYFQQSSWPQDKGSRVSKYKGTYENSYLFLE